MTAWLLLGVMTMTPETIATGLIDDLRAGHAAEAHARLGAKAQGAITADALLGAWQQVTTPLGAWEKTELSQTVNQNGLVVLIHAVRFAKGGVQTTTAVDAKLGKAEGFFIKPELGSAPPAPYAKTEAFTAVEVVVGKAPFELPGTLTIPKGKGPFPAVVLVHGSGPNDRNEQSGANRPFKDLAEGLSSRGAMVLRYDKRTLTHGKAYVGKAITFDEEVISDALFAVELLSARKDTGKIFVVGHSLGALLAPEIGSRSKAVAGVVCLAPPARKPKEIILQQFRYLGVPADKIAQTEADFAKLEAGELSGAILGAPAAYWKEWERKDGIAVAQKLGKPLLVLRGARDYQVIEEDFAAWKAGLSGTKNAVVAEIPKANHLFIEGEGKSMPAEYAVPGFVSAEVITRLAGFVGASR
jgi:uncharacterized protein